MKKGELINKIKEASVKAESFINTRNQHYEHKKAILNHQLQVENDTNSKRQQIIESNNLQKKAMEELKRTLVEGNQKRNQQLKADIK